MRRWSGWVFVLSILECACATAPDEAASAKPEQTTRAQAATVSSSSAMPGYVHTLAVSKFRIGDNVTLETPGSATFHRWRGTLGALGLDDTSGLTMGILDAPVPTGPYVLDPVAHNQMVHDYFVTAGLPADQLGDVLTSYVNGGGGAMGPTTASTNQLIRLISTVTRKVNGVPVMDSWAAASMRTTGDVDWESIYWPPIDAQTVATAVAFAASMADSSTHAKFIAGLPDAIRQERGVVIHMTRPGSHTAPRAYVAFDVFLGKFQDSGERHFDVNGSEFTLPQEQGKNASSPR